MTFTGRRLDLYLADRAEASGDSERADQHRVCADFETKEKAMKDDPRVEIHIEEVK